MASTELEALVVKLEADTTSFNSELRASQRVIGDVASKSQLQLVSMGQNTGREMQELKGLMDGAFHLFLEGGILLGAIEAVKGALETVFDAEAIRATNAQFELLAENAGLVGENLKSGLAQAADGLVDDTDLIRAANKALVAMGSTAKDLPQIMDLARKATAVFGGSVAQNFELMSQAISNGQTRALKNLGIVIDQEEAYRKFAMTLGVSTQELTEAGKQQAIMNAVLAQGDTNFKNVDDALLKNTNSWQQLKVTFEQIKEVATLAFEKLAGPAVHNILSNLGSMAQDAKRAITASLGEGSEQAAAKAEILRSKIMEIKGQLIDLEQKKLGHVLDFTPGLTQSQLQTLPKQLQAYQDELAKVDGQVKTLTETHKESANVADRATEAHRKLVEMKNLEAEAGKKIADEFQVVSPEKVMKEQLEILQQAYDQHLIDTATFYSKKADLMADAALKENLLVEAGHKKGIITDESYQKALLGLQQKHDSETQVLALKRQKDEQHETEERFGLRLELLREPVRPSENEIPRALRDRQGRGCCPSHSRWYRCGPENPGVGSLSVLYPACSRGRNRSGRERGGHRLPGASGLCPGRRRSRSIILRRPGQHPRQLGRDDPDKGSAGDLVQSRERRRGRRGSARTPGSDSPGHLEPTASERCAGRRQSHHGHVER
jgi:hypothetical protein